MKSQYQSEVALIANLLRYVIRRQKSVIGITVLGTISSLIELCAMVSIIPLGTLAGGGTILATSIWYRIPATLGFTADAKFYALLFTLLMLLRSLTMLTAQIFNQYVMRDLIAHFSSRALESFVRHLSFQDVQKQQIGHFIALAGDEANRAAQIVNALMKLVPFAVMFTLYFAAVFYKSVIAGIAVVGAGLLLLGLMQGLFGKSRRLGYRQQEESRALNSHFVDSLNGLRTVRGFTAEKVVASRYDQMIRGYARTCLSIDALSAVASNAPSLLAMGALAAGCLFFADAAWLKQNMAYLLAGAMLLLRLLPLANQALDILMKLIADLKAARNISEMLEAVQATNNSHAGLDAGLSESISRIAFERVTFRYAEDLPNVLQDFSLVLHAGKSYALTGPSGAGKSSLVDLLMKFFSPQAGAITINGRDIARMKDTDLRARIVLVEQTTRIFYDTLRRNLEFGQEQPAHEIEKVLNVVGLDALLESWPNGVDTLLDYQGSNLSGGQRQRVGLARALLRSCDVIILDESTNALDAQMRLRIVDLLLSKYADRIIIFITHDQNVMDRVDEVVILSPADNRQKQLSEAS